MRKLFYVLILLSVFSGNVIAADYFNIKVDKIENGYAYVTYTGTITMTIGTDSYHTQPINIGNANYLDGMIGVYFYTGYVSGTSDVQVLEHYSNDLTSWTNTTLDTDLDMDGVQVKNDDLGDYNGTDNKYFHGSKWLVL